MTQKAIAASLVSKRDRDEVTTIKRMLSEHHARWVVECAAIGEQIHLHLERTSRSIKTPCGSARTAGRSSATSAKHEWRLASRR
jgi:hypothetical protein